MNSASLKWGVLLEALKMSKADLVRILFPTLNQGPRALERLMAGEGYLKPLQVDALLFITGMTYDAFRAIFTTDALIAPSPDVLDAAMTAVFDYSEDIYVVCKRDAVVLFNVNLKAERKTFDLNPESSHRIEKEINLN